MRGVARRSFLVLAATGAAAAAAGVANAHGPTHQPPTAVIQHAVLNGVMDTNKKSKLGRFNFRFHVSHYGVLSGHGDYNGGGSNYILLTSVTSYSCSANHMVVVGTGNVNGNTVPVTIWAVDGGQGNANPADKFTITFGSYSRTGSPVAGHIFLKNCA